MDFPERLKQLRKEKGMTQTALAGELGVSCGTVAMWETGKRRPQFETLNRLCDMFDTELSYIMGSSEQRKIPEEDIEQLGLWAIEDDLEDVIRKYSLLDEFGQKTVDGVLRTEFARCQEQGTLNSSLSISVSVRSKGRSE